jgi:hypothetical protein
MNSFSAIEKRIVLQQPPFWHKFHMSCGKCVSHMQKRGLSGWSKSSK